ncbi:MAG: hypothetical protein KJ732_04885 [Candidatus Margulisbacteria bacterium]|nr:hypothetical protein [Candidatus Margulisiibacteriota bacterium]
MKKPFLIIVILGCALIIILSFLLNSKGTPVIPGYNTLFTRSLGNGLVLYGLEAKEGEDPASLIAVYKAAELIYRFSPLVPASVNYPRRLRLEQGEVVGGRMIVTAWGETGADYFGTHPIVIQQVNGKFKAISFYQGDLASDPRIKRISWTRKDFIVRNYFDNSEKAKTILTQGVSVTRDNKIELDFYGDELPHAAEHKIVKILLPAE